MKERKIFIVVNLRTARRSNQSIPKEISPGISLEGMMLKLKLQYFGHLTRRVDSLEKTLMLGGIGDKRRRGQQRMRWLDGITDSMDVKQQIGSKLGKEYVKAVYCHPAYLTYTQSILCKMLGWKKHKLESRLPGEISITSDMQMTPPLWQKVKRN